MLLTKLFYGTNHAKITSITLDGAVDSNIDHRLILRCVTNQNMYSKIPMNPAHQSIACICLLESVSRYTLPQINGKPARPETAPKQDRVLIADRNYVIQRHHAQGRVFSLYLLTNRVSCLSLCVFIFFSYLSKKAAQRIFFLHNMHQDGVSAFRCKISC